MLKRLKRAMTLSALCGCGLMGTVMVAEDVVKQDDFKVTPFAKVANYTPVITNMTEVLETMNERIVKRLNADPAKTVFVYADGHTTEVTFDKSTLEMTDLQPYWENLVGFVAGTNITAIGKNGFIQHPTLKYAYLPEVTDLAIQVFAICPELELVDMPKVKSIGTNTFLYDDKLATLNAPDVETITGTYSEDFGEELGAHFLGCSKLQKLNFPKLKSHSGRDSFRSMFALREVYFPELETMGTWAFAYEEQESGMSSTRKNTSTNKKVVKNSKLSPTYQEEKVDKVVKVNPVKPAYVKLITNDGKLRSVLRKKKPLLGAVVQNDEMVLSSISLPKLKKLPEGTFCNLHALVHVDIPMCEEICPDAFFDTGIQDIYCQNVTNIQNEAFSYSKIRSARFPSCTSIEQNGEYHRVFQSCDKLQSIDFPALKTCPAHMFEDLDELRFVNIGLETIPEATFKFCDKLESVIIPSAKIVQDHAFAYCKALKFVKLDNVVDFPTRTEWIQGCAFVFCTALEKVELPSCKNLGIQTFEWCNHLKEVVLPNVTNIEHWCFREAKDFTCLNLNGNTNEVVINSGAFDHGTSTTPNKTVAIVVPDSVYSRWQTTTLPTYSKLYSESGYEVVRVQDINSVINSVTPSYGTKSIMGGDTIDLIPGSPMVYSYNGDTAANVSVIVDSNKGRMGTGIFTEFIVNNIGTGTITLTYTRNNSESLFEAWRLATSGTTASITSIGPGMHKFRFSILPGKVAFWIRDTGAGSGTADATQAPYVLIEKVATYSFSSGTITP